MALHHAPEFPTVVCWEKVTIADPRLAMKVTNRLWVGKPIYADLQSVGKGTAYTVKRSVGDSVVAHGASVGKEESIVFPLKSYLMDRFPPKV